MSKKITKTLKQIESKLKPAMIRARKDLSLYIGKDAIIPYGEYKGRLGMITGTSFDLDNNIIACIQPYRLAGGPREDLLWNHVDARTYWPITDKDLK